MGITSWQLIFTRLITVIYLINKGNTLLSREEIFLGQLKEQCMHKQSLYFLFSTSLQGTGSKKKNITEQFLVFLTKSIQDYIIVLLTVGHSYCAAKKLLFTTSGK